MNNIIIVGSGGLVVSHFVRIYKEQYNLVLIERKDDIQSVGDQNYDALIFLAQSSEYKITPFSEDLFNVNVGLDVS